MFTSPTFKTLKTKMVKAAQKEAPKRKVCPKCRKNRKMEAFGIRTQHDSKGRPVRSIPQSYCTPCRKGSSTTASTH